MWRGLAVVVIGCGGGAAPQPVAVTAPPPPITAQDLKPAGSGGPPMIDPRLLEPRRVAGDKVIWPDAEALAAARNAGGRIVAAFKYCIDETGHVTDVRTIEATHVQSYDLRLTSGIQRWAFTPVVVEGRPTAVCSAASFIVNAR